MAEHCDDHKSTEKTANDAMILARKTWDKLNVSLQDLKWLKLMGWCVFLIGLGVFGTGLKLIFDSGRVVERFQMHETLQHHQIDKELEQMRETTKELHRLYQEIIFFKSTESIQKMSQKKKEIEDRKKEIIALKGE